MKRLECLLLTITIFFCVEIVKTQSVSANQRVGYERTDVESVPPEEYYVNDTTAKLVEFEGTKQHTEIIPKSSLIDHVSTVWISQSKTTVYVKGVPHNYFYVVNASSGITGWLPEYVLHLNRDLKLGMIVSTPDTNYRAKNAVVSYQLIKTGSIQSLKASGRLTTGQVYAQIATRVSEKNNRLEMYSLLKDISGTVIGWAKTSALERVALGSTTSTGVNDGVSYFRTAGSVVTTPSQISTLSLIGNGAYTNKTIAPQPPKDYAATNELQNEPETIPSSGGYLAMYQFKTSMFLPQLYRGRSLVNPQSATFSSDDRYLYVMYVDIRQHSDVNQTGWVVRYDWQKLVQLGASTPGHMEILRQAAKDSETNPDKLSKLDSEILSCIKVGPKFVSGHAESLTINPQNNELWYTRVHGTTNPHFAVRLNLETLKPDATVQFDMGTTSLGSPLSFDNQGNAYTWTRVGQNVLLYKGKIGTDNVHFEEAGQQLYVGNEFAAQSVGYNASNNRLYLVANENIISLPAENIGNLTAKQVGESEFSGTKEFQGLMFMHHSPQGFLLTNSAIQRMEASHNG